METELVQYLVSKCSAESKAIEVDDKQTACRTPSEKLMRDRGVWIGRESYSGHIELYKCFWSLL